MAPTSEEITRLLQAWRQGDNSALRELMPHIYAELHRLARRHMAQERPGHTLQATALINEAYLRLSGVREIEWQDRAHFFAMAAQLMRRILVDAARARGYRKRGGGAARLTLDENMIPIQERGRDLIALDDALNVLSTMDLRKSKVVELRFFGGLSAEEAAAVLKVSPETVLRDWKLSKAWLRREMSKQTRAAARGASS